MSGEEVNLLQGVVVDGQAPVISSHHDIARTAYETTTATIRMDRVLDSDTSLRWSFYTSLWDTKNEAIAPSTCTNPVQALPPRAEPEMKRGPS